MTWYWLALIPFMALVFAMTSNILDTPKGNDMSTTEGPLPQHELDQVLAAMKADGIGIDHVIGSMAVLDTVLEELPTAPPGMENHALVSLTAVRGGLEAHKARFFQIFTALTGAKA